MGAVELKQMHLKLNQDAFDIACQKSKLKMNILEKAFQAFNAINITTNASKRASEMSIHVTVQRFLDAFLLVATRSSNEIWNFEKAYTGKAELWRSFVKLKTSQQITHISITESDFLSTHKNEHLILLFCKSWNLWNYFSRHFPVFAFPPFSPIFPFISNKTWFKLAN